MQPLTRFLAAARNHPLPQGERVTRCCASETISTAFRPNVCSCWNPSIAGTSNGRTVIACKETFHVREPDTDLVTSRMLGCFRDDALTRQEFLAMATDAMEDEDGRSTKFTPRARSLARCHGFRTFRRQAAWARR